MEPILPPLKLRNLGDGIEAPSTPIRALVVGNVAGNVPEIVDASPQIVVNSAPTTPRSHISGVSGTSNMTARARADFLRSELRKAEAQMRVEENELAFLARVEGGEGGDLHLAPDGEWLDASGLANAQFFHIGDVIDSPAMGSPLQITPMQLTQSALSSLPAFPAPVPAPWQTQQQELLMQVHAQQQQAAVQQLQNEAVAAQLRLEQEAAQRQAQIMEVQKQDLQAAAVLQHSFAL